MNCFKNKIKNGIKNELVISLAFKSCVFLYYNKISIQAVPANKCYAFS